MDRPRPLVLGAVVTLAIVSISTASILFRLSEAPALVKAFYRLAIATALLGTAALALPGPRRELAALDPRTWLGLVAVGIVLAVHFASWVKSLDLTTVAASVVLVTIHPVLVGIVSAQLFGEGFAARGWFGAGLALAGGLLITWSDWSDGTHRFVGDLLALAGAVAAAIYFLAGRSYRRRLSLLAYVVPVYLSCSLALLAMALANGDRLVGWPAREWALFLALAVVPMVLGHTLLNYALKFVTAPVIATTILGEPVGSTVLALAILNEAPPALTAVGGAIVLAGIAIVMLAGGARDTGPPVEGPTA